MKFVLAIALALVAGTLSAAEPPTYQELKSEVAELKKRVAELEKKTNTPTYQPAPAVSAPVVPVCWADQFGNLHYDAPTCAGGSCPAPAPTTRRGLFGRWR